MGDKLCFTTSVSEVRGSHHYTCSPLYPEREAPPCSLPSRYKVKQQLRRISSMISVALPKLGLGGAAGVLLPTLNLNV